MARKKAATEDDIKAASVEPAKQNEEQGDNQSVKQDQPISLEGPVMTPAQKDVKITPIVDIEHKDGEVVAVERHVDGGEFARLDNDELVELKDVKSDDPPANSNPPMPTTPTTPTDPAGPTNPTDELDKLKDRVATLEKENSDLKATVKAFEDHSKADKEEIDRLNKEILESDTEKLRAQVETLKRENELLLGSVAAPNKVYFG